MKLKPLLLPILSVVLVISTYAQSIPQGLADLLGGLQENEPNQTVSAPLPEPNKTQSEAEFLKTAYAATFLLYYQDASGSMNMSCTATSIVKVADGYALLTAAHCMNPDYIYFVTKDESGTKKFYPVTGAICGSASKGLDFCLLHVITKEEFAVVPLGVDPAGIGGEAVAAISSPLGLGKQILRGSIASPHVERPLLLKDKNGKDDIANWYEYIVLQMPGINPASSGSSLLCLKQRAVCGVIVGAVAASFGAEPVAVPVSPILTRIERSGVAHRAPKPTLPDKK